MAKLVCVVEPDDEVRATLSLALREMNFETLEVQDSRKVSGVLAAHPVDAIVLAILMPNKDGLELITEIRQRWPDLRIIAMTTGGRIGPSLYLELARQLGANACLRKPIVAEQLLAALLIGNNATSR